MSDHEKSGGELSKADKRNAELASEEAQSAAERTRGIINRHNGLLGRELIELIIQRDYEDAYSRAIDRRETGQMNDGHSLNPGLTLYLTTRGEEAIVRLSDEHGLPHADMLEAAEDKPGCFRLRLDEGVYSMGLGGATLYDKGGVDADGSLIHDGEPLTIGYTFIVRIEGDAGELWQNWNYNSDGTLKKIEG